MEVLSDKAVAHVVEMVDRDGFKVWNGRQGDYDCGRFYDLHYAMANFMRLSPEPIAWIYNSSEGVWSAYTVHQKKGNS